MLAEFYKLPQQFTVFLFFLITAEIIMQVFVFVFGIGRLKLSKSEKLGIFFEFLILIQLAVMAYLIGEMKYNAESVYVVSGGIVNFRYLLVLLLAVVGIIYSWKEQIFWPLCVPVAASITLPLIEETSVEIYDVMFILCTAFFFVRCIHGLLRRKREKEHVLDGTSIKEAVDTLHVGLLFCRPDGLISLQNTQMQILMKTLTGEMQASGKVFYERLLCGAVQDCSRMTEMGEQIAYRLPDGKIWMFEIHNLTFKKHPYKLLVASDLTDRWNATHQLWLQNEELEEKNKELRSMLNNLESICKMEEMARAKSWLHDMMGQKISLLLRSLQEHKEPDEEILYSFAEDFPEQIRKIPESLSEQVISTLVETYAKLGVKIIVKGSPAEEERVSKIQAEIATEGVTNAVRHGYAQEIHIDFDETEEVWKMDITNDGLLPDGNIKEGGGLREIRRKIMLLNGMFYYEKEPVFHISTAIPRGDVK